MTDIEIRFKHQGPFWNGTIQFLADDNPNRSHFLTIEEFHKLGNPSEIIVTVRSNDAETGVNRGGRTKSAKGRKATKGHSDRRSSSKA